MKLKNPEVRIETVNTCNLSCSVCARDRLTRKMCVMKHIHFTYLVLQAKNLGADIISVFGFGEPLMDRNLSKHIGYVSKIGLKSFITTNATLLDTDRAYELLNAGLSQIRFSVHGLWDEYRKTHGFEFNETIRNIFNFTAIAKNYDCKTCVTCIPTTSSVDEIRDFWEDKVDELEIWRPHNWVNAKDYREGDVVKKTCGRPFRGPLQINADGKMMVCCFDFDAKMTVGDTHKNTLKSILVGKEFEKIRQAHHTGELAGLPCENCDQLYEYPDKPLLYSNVEDGCGGFKTSTIKFRLEE